MRSNSGTEVRGQVTGLDRYERVDGRCSPNPASSEQFVPVERGVGPRDDRPCVRVGGRFAGEVPGVELLEGGVDVVGVERDVRHDPSSASISTMLSTSVWNASAAGRGPRADTSEGEALAAGRDDGRRRRS